MFKRWSTTPTAASAASDTSTSKARDSEQFSFDDPETASQPVTPTMEQAYIADGTDASVEESENIKVGVRIRPLSREEQDKNEIIGWSWADNRVKQEVFPNYTKQRFKGFSGASDKDRQTDRQSEYEFDFLFTPDHSTQMIYNVCIRRLVHSAMEGFHGSVFAYGQTSTGKTHTMQGTSTEPGIIPQAVYECFTYIDMCSNREFLFRVSYLEVYNEQIHDLLNPEATNIRIVHEPNKGTIVRGTKEQVVMTPEQVFGLISSGEAHRHIGTTNVNEKSSRSHTIFRLTIESKERDKTQSDPIRVSSLSLVDLAGSENAKMTDTKGTRQQEARFINQSLLTLSTVIQKLSDTRPGNQTQHIPYRNSKLTRILQTSLSGNAQVAIICTASPALRCMEETHNTLKFASRAKRIKHRAQINETVDEKTLLRQYREEIQVLRAQLAAAQAPQLQEEVPERDPQVVLNAIEKLERLILKSQRVKGDAATPSPGQRRPSASGITPLNGHPAGETPFFEKRRKKTSDPHAQDAEVELPEHEKGSAPNDEILQVVESEDVAMVVAADDQAHNFFEANYVSNSNGVGTVSNGASLSFRMRSPRRPRDSFQTSANPSDDVFVEMRNALSLLKLHFAAQHGSEGIGELSWPLEHTSRSRNTTLDAYSSPEEEIAFLRKVIEDMDEELTAYKNANQKLKDDITAVVEKFVELEASMGELQDDNTVLRLELEHLQKANDDLSKYQSRLQQVLSSREQEILDLKGIAPHEETF